MFLRPRRRQWKQQRYRLNKNPTQWNRSGSNRQHVKSPLMLCIRGDFNSRPIYDTLMLLRMAPMAPFSSRDTCA